MDIEVINNMKKHNLCLACYACLDDDAIRLEEIDNDFRTSFYRDIDRVIYSLSYIRYVDKTQVFSNINNDMISKRMTHVQLVSKIARTIGRALSLNEDLIEAASLGHDLGHVPFGHVGEKILNDISVKYNEGYFNHNVQSVRTLMCLENNGLGNNLTIQVLDAILCHNGEKLERVYRPKVKTKKEFLREYEDSYFDKNVLKELVPMTLEGCVVRVSDILAYIGKDIDDAIRLGVIKREDIPVEITNVLGDTNAKIIDKVVRDIISNSLYKNYIEISNEIYNALSQLIEFNYVNIYNKANTKQDVDNYRDMFNKLFCVYYNQISENKIDENIFTLFLNDMNGNYNKESVARKVIDYIAGMTDDFFMSEYDKYCK